MPTFDEVNTLIPRASKGDKHSVITQVYPDVRVKTPGKYGPADFVVEVNCDNAGWKWRKFTHEDIFEDIKKKTDAEPSFMQVVFSVRLAEILVNGNEPEILLGGWLPGVTAQTLLEASQVLAVAEHRRYAKFEKIGGGRFLPARFAMGIIDGLWTADDAAAFQKSGSKGLNILIQKFGEPTDLKELV